MTDIEVHGSSHRTTWRYFNEKKWMLFRNNLFKFKRQEKKDENQIKNKTSSKPHERSD